MTVEEAVTLFTERGFYGNLSGAIGSRRLFVASNWRESGTSTALSKADTATNPTSKPPGIVEAEADIIKPLEGLAPVYRFDDSASISETDHGWLFFAMDPSVEMQFTSLDEAVQTLEAWFKHIPEFGDSSLSLDEAVQLLEQAQLKVDVSGHIMVGRFGPHGEIMRSLQSYAIIRHGGVIIVILPNDTTYGRITIGTSTLFQAVQKVLAFYGKED